MKAITTGFAVTALAAAISGQAMAETTADWTWAGEVEVKGYLVENEIGPADVDAVSVGDRGMDSTYDLEASVAVANGGFSATMEIVAGDDAAVADAVEISVSDFMYEEGAISFGEIGDIVSTATYIDGMDENLDYTSDSAFRFTGEGFAVQAEAGVSYTDDDDDLAPTALRDFGFSAAYSGEADALSYAVDVQYGEDATDVNDTALDMFYGVGVTFAASDAVSVKGAYTSGQGAETSMAARADFTADAMTAYGEYISNSSSATGADIAVGGTYTVDALGLYADYEMNDAASDFTAGATYAGEADALTYNAGFEYAMDLENSVNTYEYYADAAYAVNEMTTAGASYTFRHDESTETEAYVAYTTEGGAVIKAMYEVDTGTEADDEEDDYTIDAIWVSASYSF